MQKKDDFEARYRESQLEDLLYAFAELGGEPAFLLRTLSSHNWHPIFFVAKSDLRFHRACSEAMQEAAQILEDTGFEKSAVETALLCASIHSAFAKIKQELSGNPVQARTYYWVGALLPYLCLKTGEPQWRWIEDWVNYIGQQKDARCNILRVSAPKGTAFLKHQLAGKESKQHKIIRKALQLGVQSGMAYLTGRPIENLSVKVITQQIQAILHRMHLGELHPKPYILFKNMLSGKSVTAAKDNTPENLINRLAPAQPIPQKARKATAVEIRFYKEALSRWPGLEPGLKAEVLKSGIKI